MFPIKDFLIALLTAYLYYYQFTKGSNQEEKGEKDSAEAKDLNELLSDEEPKFDLEDLPEKNSFTHALDEDQR